MCDGTMRINGKLKEKLTTGYINVYSIPDCTVLAIKSVEAVTEDACRVTKSGEVKVFSLIDSLKENNIEPPIRYTAEWNESYSFWQAEIDIAYSFRSYTKKPLEKKKKKAAIS